MCVTGVDREAARCFRVTLGRISEREGGEGGQGVSVVSGAGAESGWMGDRRTAEVGLSNLGESLLLFPLLLFLLEGGVVGSLLEGDNFDASVGCCCGWAVSADE